jgi:hypothetical protein
MSFSACGSVRRRDGRDDVVSGDRFEAASLSQTRSRNCLLRSETSSRRARNGDRASVNIPALMEVRAEPALLHRGREVGVRRADDLGVGRPARGGCFLN